MAHPRFEFALSNATIEHWRAFEKLCAEFMVAEFPDLRTTASSSGDKGRDGELFTLPAAPRTVFQYSVQSSWKKKISATVKRLEENFTDVRRLIFCSSQEIGAQADEIKESLWNESGIQLDVRDRNWFIERAAKGTERIAAADSFAADIADPLLQEKNLVTVIATPLNREESRVALLQLALNERDRETERGITKTSFEALVRAALVDTNSASTRTLESIQEAVCGYMPGANSAQVEALVASALQRLSKRRGPVKHRTDTGGYHLAHEEHLRLTEHAASYVLDQDEVENDLVAAIYGLNGELDSNYEMLKSEAASVRVILESLLLQKGEAFVTSITSDVETEMDQESIETIERLNGSRLLSSQSVATAISRLLAEPSDRSRNHLVRVLDAYTLFAFLQQTPDVQKTLTRVFSGGEIWLDTSAILPLLAETLVDSTASRGFTNVIESARRSGIKLYVTGGVIEEIETHLNNALRYTQITADWEGRIPFVYTAYMFSGRAESEFSEWLEIFRGSTDPRQDILEYLEHYFGISRRDLTDLSDGADIKLRGAVQELWQATHQKRRRNRRNHASGSTQRLISHDVENVVGVIEYRRTRASHPLGYTAWWLTLDGTAYRLAPWLQQQLGKAAPHSPVLSPDYLAQILRLGPLRRELGKTDISNMPLSMSVRAFDNVPQELIDVARSTRERFAGFDEFRIRREVRDALNRSRYSSSQESEFATSLETEIIESLDKKAK